MLVTVHVLPTVVFSLAGCLEDVHRRLSVTTKHGRGVLSFRRNIDVEASFGSFEVDVLRVKMYQSSGVLHTDTSRKSKPGTLLALQRL
jgi:hypothetical protein